MRWASSVDPADVLGICKLQIYLSMSRQLYKSRATTSNARLIAGDAIS